MRPAPLATLVCACLLSCPAFGAGAQDPQATGSIYDVTAFGARGDGKSIDSPAINRAIEAAAARGGGTVVLPAGTYASYSLHLRSNVSIRIEAGATLVAAEPTSDLANSYDPPEPNPNDPYEDFGHSHFHNSLIWGDGVENVTLSGPGRIYGFGLSRGSYAYVRDATPEESRKGIHPRSAPAATHGPTGPFGYPGKDTLPPGMGNKAIALRGGRNIAIRDLTFVHAGHFGILATGVENLEIRGLTIDTNRDGMDIDSCRNVRVSDCLVNSPKDDGICLKADYALGFVKPCENVAITNCIVSGFDEGTVLDGTFRTRDKVGRYGRIKLGTEASGGFRNIAVSNCVFDTCNGLAIEEVDGAALEDVAVDNLVMRNIVNSVIYVRLGGRNRAPEGTQTGTLKRVRISNVEAWTTDPRTSCIVMGVPGHPIEGLSLSHIRIRVPGGGAATDASVEPPEAIKDYPEPGRHGPMPAFGFFIRHAANVSFDHVEIDTQAADARPAFVLEDVAGARFERVIAPAAPGAARWVLRSVGGFETFACPGAPDSRIDEPAGPRKL